MIIDLIVIASGTVLIFTLTYLFTSKPVMK
jgi:hypothetical protein